MGLEVMTFITRHSDRGTGRNLLVPSENQATAKELRDLSYRRDDKVGKSQGKQLGLEVMTFITRHSERGTGRNLLVPSENQATAKELRDLSYRRDDEVGMPQGKQMGLEVMIFITRHSDRGTRSNLFVPSENQATAKELRDLSYRRDAVKWLRFYSPIIFIYKPTSSKSQKKYNLRHISRLFISFF